MVPTTPDNKSGSEQPIDWEDRSDITYIIPFFGKAITVAELPSDERLEQIARRAIEKRRSGLDDEFNKIPGESIDDG